MTYKHIHQPYSTLEDKPAKPTYEELEKEAAELRGILKIITEKISDATYHGERSFTACLNYIDVLIKAKS